MSQPLDKIEIYNNQTKRSSTYELQDANAQQKIKQLQEQFEQPIQEQINNWLDNHPEATTTIQDGSVEECKFTDTLKLRKASFYNCISDMKADANLTVGMTAITHGYYKANDGGAGTFLITESNNPDNGGSIHVLANGKRAELIIENNIVNANQFGANGDGITDCSDKIQSAIDFVVNKPIKLQLTGIHRLTKPLKISGKIDLGGSSKGVRPTLFVDKSVECIISVDVTDYYGKDISIKDIILESREGNSIGIKFNSCRVIYNVLDNILFNGFNNSCIAMVNDGNTLVKQAYSHNICWKHIHTFNCSSFISNITINSGKESWIYGGVVEDCDFEGKHGEDGNSYLFDFTGFRNVIVKNLIIEGSQNSSKDGIIFCNHGVTFQNIYFELINSDKFINNSFIIDNSMSYQGVVIYNLYGALKLPIYVIKKDIVKIKFAYPQLNIRNLLDTRSLGWLDITDVTFGTLSQGNPEDCVLSSRNSYRNLCVGGENIKVDDSKPIFQLNSKEFVENGSKIMYFSQKFGKINCATNENSLYGTSVVIENDTYNLLLNSMIIDVTSLGLSDSDWVTMCLTYKVLSEVPEHCKSSALNLQRHVVFDKLYRDKDDVVTVLWKFPINNTKLLNYQFDFVSKLTDDLNYTKQRYEILDVSLFLGGHFGSCKSKLNSNFRI